MNNINYGILIINHCHLWIIVTVKYRAFFCNYKFIPVIRKIISKKNKSRKKTIFNQDNAQQLTQSSSPTRYESK